MDKNRVVRKSFSLSSRLFREATVFLYIQLLATAPSYTSPAIEEMEYLGSYPVATVGNSSTIDVLKNSEISYHAKGGFTGIQSYSVIISCVEGRISVLKSLHDPQATQSMRTLREKEGMSVARYLHLWESLQKHRIFNVKNAPRPKVDIRDEFTIHFQARVGNRINQFNVYGDSRPEAARYFALKCLIDSASHMKSIWRTHQALASK